jgi:hypothetical protein
VELKQVEEKSFELFVRGHSWSLVASGSKRRNFRKTLSYALLQRNSGNHNVRAERLKSASVSWNFSESRSRKSR